MCRSREGKLHVHELRMVSGRCLYRRLEIKEVLSGQLKIWRDVTLINT